MFSHCTLLIAAAQHFNFFFFNLSLNMLSQKCATNLSDQLSFGQQWVPSEADWNRQCPPQSSSWSLLTEGIPAGPSPPTPAPLPYSIPCHINPVQAERFSSSFSRKCQMLPLNQCIISNSIKDWLSLILFMEIIST